jgi:hypothetical protein
MLLPPPCPGTTLYGTSQDVDLILGGAAPAKPLGHQDGVTMIRYATEVRCWHLRRNMAQLVDIGDVHKPSPFQVEGDNLL